MIFSRQVLSRIQFYVPSRLRCRYRRPGIHREKPDRKLVKVRLSLGRTLSFARSATTGVPAVGGLKFSIAQKNCKKCQWGKWQLGEVPVGGSASWGRASWGKWQLGGVPVGRTASWGNFQLGSASWGNCQLGDKNLALKYSCFPQLALLLTGTSPNWSSPRNEIPQLPR